MLKEWDQLPEYMRTEEVRPYYEKLKKKKASLALKRVFDIFVSAFMLIILSPLMIVLSIVIKLDSNGDVFFRQERITQYGRKFRIFKFRTMVENAEQLGSQVTVKNDMRLQRLERLLESIGLMKYHS